MRSFEFRLVLAAVVFMVTWWVADFTAGIVMLAFVGASAFIDHFRAVLPEWMIGINGSVRPEVHAAVPVMLIMCSMVLFYFGTVAPVFIVVTAVLDLIWSKTVWHIEDQEGK
jgi:hypothetical protein